jgi:hypothetical protein
MEGGMNKTKECINIFLLNIYYISHTFNQLDIKHVQYKLINNVFILFCPPYAVLAIRTSCRFLRTQKFILSVQVLKPRPNLRIIPLKYKPILLCIAFLIPNLLPDEISNTLSSLIQVVQDGHIVKTHRIFDRTNFHHSLPQVLLQR